MSKYIILILGILCSYYANSQACEEALFMKKGTILEYTDYNKKGKEKRFSLIETINVKETNNKLIATIRTTSYEKKNKDEETFLIEHKATCENGLFSIDMMRFFDTSKLEEYEGDDEIVLTIDGDVLEFPSEMEAGTTLNDGSIAIKVNKNDFTLVTMIFNITNRKIVGEETITTKAGTFECNKVTFDYESKIGILKFRGSGTEWYDKNKVVVKSQSFNKKQKLISTTELTAIK